MRFILVIIPALLSSLLHGQQFASLLLSTSGGTHSISADPSTFLNDGFLIENELMMVDENTGENVALDFAIANPLEEQDNYTVYLIDETETLFYGFQIINGEIWIMDELNSILISSSPGQGYNFYVYRCDSTIFYVHENEVLYCRNISGNGIQLNAQVHVEEAVGSEIEVAIHPPTSCPYSCDPVRQQYLVLDDFMNWRQHVMTDTIIKFQYVEKYYPAEGVNKYIYFELLDDQNNVVIPTQSRLNKYGINLQEWSIHSNELVPGSHYVFRVWGMNKEKKYNIRIRYDG